ncbi:RNA methylase PF01170 family [Bacteriovorax sp. Seq25_V]|uniref:RNA methylase PF01170 family n=1 Tax=Bacteriovorax sp. Seq25_V TaxID=1201288 RepID=UPI00038A3D3A|nr:RNA methylase PF01170 family [Bacteriovorax sp. Seq25_V]EQC44891.1 RNA methylase, PF01170 family [Bacteriovorax sp. Seq25_V]
MENYTQLFLVIIPGLEGLAMDEIKNKVPLDISSNWNALEIHKGGISIKTNNIRDIQTLHRILKIPTRILIRLSTFKAKDFPKLYKQLLKIEWANYIPWVLPELKFSSFNAKLFDDRKVKKTLIDAINDQTKASPPKLKYKDLKWQECPTVYIRNEENEVTVSLDLTGERLDRRGKKLLTTKAPIRESIAAAMFQNITNLCKDRASSLTLFDPMAGSGTILFEAHDFSFTNPRHFNFQEMPFFFKNQFSQNVEMLPANLDLIKILSNDIDEEAANTLKENAQEYDIENLSVLTGNFFEKKLDELKGQDNLVILSNPPYNKRIKTDVKMDEFLEMFMKKATELSPIIICIITPIEHPIPVLPNYKRTELKPVLNGGLETKIVSYVKSL